MSEEALGPPDPEELAGRGALAAERTPSELTLGPVHLTVADLGRSLDYYRTQIGLDVLGEQDRAALSKAVAARSHAFDFSTTAGRLVDFYVEVLSRRRGPAVPG